MKRHIIPLYIATAALLALAGCTDEQLPGTATSNIAFTPKGEPVEAYLNLSVSGLSVTATTRANTVEETDEERKVYDLWVFQYDGKASNATYEQLIAPPQYVSVEDQTTLAAVPVTLSNNDGEPSIIYVVTNTAYDTWAKYSANGSYDGFMTVDELKANNIPTPKPQRMKYNYNYETYVPYDDGTISIPMSGSTGEDGDVIVSNGTTVTVNVERMFAKLCIQVDLSNFNEDYKEAKVYNITVGNIPEYSTVNTLFTEEDEPGDYDNCKQWITRAFDNNESTEYNEDIYPYVIYVPESIQGVNDRGSEVKSENVPDAAHSTTLETEALSVTVDVQAITVENDATIGPYSFIVYPGGDEKTNFNVKRNCVYNITVTISNFNEDDLKAASANCIVCLSSEDRDVTTTFYPYYRLDEGGGYKFIDYLNYVYGEGYTDENGNVIDEDPDKRIDHVQIIWQSENGAGTGGYIGDNSDPDNPLVWIDEAPSDLLTDEGKSKKELNRKIYVKIPQGEIGNALIGAYNSTSDEPIWSWHIWTRNEDDDPSNEANGVLYYTYDWDSDGIKYNEPRIAGYTVMNCNLGAMADAPTTSGGIETYGTLYQWGRKDPFPPANFYNTSTTWSDYTRTNVGNLYSNDDNLVGMTSLATSSGNLFYSVPGNDRESSIGTTFDDYINYSIHEPTVFICGTQEVGVSITEQTNYPSSLSNYADPQDGNWILDSDGEHYNSLWGGLDPDNDNISKSFDTGYKDSRGYHAHLYDDYGTEKSIFDPCPYGWRVSPPDLWLGFTDTGLNPSSMSDVNYKSYTNHGFYMYMDGWKDEANITSFFPLQGTRLADGSLYNSGICGNYLNATADLGDRVNILHLHNSVSLFHIFEVSLIYFYVKSLAGPVRCVRFGSVSN